MQANSEKTGLIAGYVGVALESGELGSRVADSGCRIWQGAT
jgi:hypothetical protein